MTEAPDAVGTLVREALALLGVDRLVLAIHDAAFPAGARDLGVGSPASPGGRAFLAHVAGQGFDAVQLGPHGETTAANASPYDSTLFSRNLARLDAAALVDDGLVGGLLTAAQLDDVLAGRPAERDHCHFGWARAAVGRLLGLAQAALPVGPGGARRAAELAAFRARTRWLAADSLYEALVAEHGHDDWSRWPAEDRALGHDPASPRAISLRARHAPVIDRFELAQWLLELQHQRLRAHAGALGVRLLGDLHVGFSPRDTWALAPLFLRDYAMGAPPSRTNPEGQPWGYPVLDPALRGRLDAPGPVLRHLGERFDHLLASYDGLRIDHPHGWVCPWVYLRGGDEAAAVRAGARLFESPDLPDHPALAAYALVRAEQIDTRVPRHHDDRVRALDEAQLERYAICVDLMVERALAHGRERRDLAFEVLSTCPRPLQAVLARHGLGRFRVTQKASLTDAADVYRIENAAPEDWAMIGSHDTPRIWALLAAWRQDDRCARRAALLAQRLTPGGGDPTPLAQRLQADDGLFVDAMLAELLGGPARHVVVHVGDWLGEAEPYNRPGVVDDENWSWRVPPDHVTEHARRRARGRAMSLPRAAALALRARGAAPDLAARLEALAV